MKLYKITLWSERYENNRTRELKRLDWLPLPNRHDGENYGRLMARADGVQIFAAWVLILQVASRCEIRGTLTRDDGTPLDSESLAIRTRANKTLFEKALPALVQMGWLQAVEVGDTPMNPEDSADGCDVTAVKCGEVAIRCPEEKGMEEKGMEGAAGAVNASSLTDEEWLNRLLADAVYEGIDIKTEYGKAQYWCEVRRRKLTRRFFVNWLNRIERPMRAQAKPSDTVDDLWKKHPGKTRNEVVQMLREQKKKI